MSETASTADVLIAGGGLAGAATALCLANAGLGAVLIDRAAFPRDKPCGEGLLPHGVEVLRDWGLGRVLDDAEAPPFRGILYRCREVTAVGDFAGGARGRGVRRLRLDAAVRAAAAARPGCTLVQGTVADVAADDERVAVRLADGRWLRGRFLVGADGPRSLVRQRLGLDRGQPRHGRFALRGHFRLAAGAALPERVEVNVLPGYELYVTPVAPGLVGVAALVERAVLQRGWGTPVARLAALADACPAVRERLAGATAEGEVLTCGPLRVRARAVHRGRAALVGDAAGYVDAITGEGMSLALRTAELAAAWIAAVLRDGQPVGSAMRAYAAARATIFRDHALLTHGLVWLARHPWLARRAVARLAREPDLFTRLLEVNDGRRTLWSLPPTDALKLALGAG